MQKRPATASNCEATTLEPSLFPANLASIPLLPPSHHACSLRGKHVYDGSWGGNGEGFLPCPPGVAYCIRVSSFPAGVKLSEFVEKQLLPAPASEVGYLGGAIVNTVRNGELVNRTATSVAYVDARGGKPLAGDGAAILAQAMRTLSGVVTPGKGEADVWPGRRHKVPTGAVEWIALQLAPKGPEMSHAMFELGRAEALSWAQEQGFPAALAKQSLAPHPGK